MPQLLPILKSSPVITRYPTPILTKKDVPYETSLVFNAGVVKYNGKYVMIFRNDFGCNSDEEYIDRINKKLSGVAGTDLGLALSDDGIHWTVTDKPFMSYKEMFKYKDVQRFYDPRLTVIDNELYMCFAIDTNHGIRGGIGKIHDLKTLEIISITAPDNRNMVLFPEKINGKYVRLERPFPVYSRGGKDRFDMWISSSPDMKYWGDTELLLAVEDVPFANDKLGPSAPPIKTEKGWLTTFHAVDIDPTRGKNGWGPSWTKRYTAGIMLLDLNDPYKIIGYSKKPLIAPESFYETDIDVYRSNVIFPGGMILEDDGEVKIYYGASDTFECLATANVNDLINLCLE